MINSKFSLSSGLSIGWNLFNLKRYTFIFWYNTFKFKSLLSHSSTKTQKDSKIAKDLGSQYDFSKMQRKAAVGFTKALECYEVNSNQ